MDKKQLYTCLSHTNEYEYIHLDNKTLNNRYYPRCQPRLELLNSYFNSVYHDGKINEISFEQCDKQYIGSTYQELEDTLKEHATDKESVVYRYRNDKPAILLVQHAPGKDKKCLEKVENEYIHA